MRFEDAGNTLGTARNLDITPNIQTFRDSVSPLDRTDYYSFSLKNRSSFNLSVDGLSGDADVQLIRDSNSNGRVDRGEIIAGSYRGGKSTESISRNLDSGSYFVRVFPYSNNNTFYNLKVSAQTVNAAPEYLKFGLNKTDFGTTETINISNGRVYDSDGIVDISRVDFRIRKANGSLIDVADVRRFGSLSERWGGFDYVLSLKDLKLDAGDYKLWAVAYDSQGAKSNTVEQGFTIAKPNYTPQDLNFKLNKTSFESTETLTTRNGWVYDRNGASDLDKIDFRIRKSDGNFIDVADVTKFALNGGTNNPFVTFRYSLSLKDLNLNAGDYKLWAVAYDSQGAKSNIAEQEFTLVNPNSTPRNLNFRLNRTSFESTETLSTTRGWVYDNDGANDLEKVDFRIRKRDGSFIDVADVTSFTPYSRNNKYGDFEYSLSFKDLDLASGNYSLWAVAYDSQGEQSNILQKSFRFTKVESNAAPELFQFGLNKTSFNNRETLSVTDGLYKDSDGFNDLKRIDFRIIKSNGNSIDIADATNFSAVSGSRDRGKFNYSVSLANLNLSTGDYKLWAVAYDSQGAKSKGVHKDFSITAARPNVTPRNLRFNLSKTSFDSAETLTTRTGWVYDSDGANDLKKVDFKIRKSDGSFIDVGDVSSFTPYSKNNKYGDFEYSLSLKELNLAAGNYKLWAVAYDSQGAKSNVYERSIRITGEIDPDPGNTLAKAEFQRRSVFSRNQQVSNRDRDDFYRFNVNQSGVFTANLSNLTGDADVRLIQDKNRNGVIDSGEIIAWQWERETGSESIRKFLNRGTYFLQVMSYNNQSANYTVDTNFKAATRDNLDFSIDVNFGSGSNKLNSAMRNSVQQAARFWENVISHSSLDGSHNIDIEITTEDKEWSEKIKIGASAGSRNRILDTNSNWMPITGESNINSNPDALNYFSSNINSFTRVMIHEFGHVLGFSENFKNGAKLINKSTETYKSNSNAGWAYGELLGTYQQTAIPLASKDYSHWNEDIFQQEIMTPSANNKSMPLSQMTIAALNDLGWNVNYGAAEDYSLPSSSTIKST